MAQEPEVIQQELERTRHELATKLEQIGEKISGTVDTVTETVSNVTETVSNVSEAVSGTVQNVADAVSGTVESVKETVSNVGEKAGDAVESIRQAFNLPEQIRSHPWLWVGGSVALGFLGGKILAPRGSRTPKAESFAEGRGYRATPAEMQGMPPPAAEHGGSRDHEPAQAADTDAEKSGSWLGSVVEHFGGEINKLKGLALGALFGVARDVVSQSLPETLKDQVAEVFDDITDKVGGEPIHGHVLGDEAEGASSRRHDEPSRGGDDDQFNPTAMDRPLGAAERKGKATVG